MITPTGDLRPALRAVIFENSTGTAIWPFEAPYGEPETTPRIGTVPALATAGTAASPATVATIATMREMGNICASEVGEPMSRSL